MTADIGNPGSGSSRGNLMVVLSITLVAVQGVAAISPVFPGIVRDLGISSRSVGLLITAFTVPSIMLAPILGMLADRFGRVHVLVPSLTLFAVAGVGCATAGDFASLVGLRLLQGCGAAALGPLVLTLIGDHFEEPARTRVMGYNAAVLCLGTGAYLILGGYLGQFDWRIPFLLPLLALPVGLLLIARLGSSASAPHTVRWNSSAVLWHWIRTSSPLRGLYAAGGLTVILFYGTVFTFVPLLLDEQYGLSPGRIGILLAGASLSTAATASRIGRLTQTVSRSTLLKVSYLLFGLVLASLPYVEDSRFLPLHVLLWGVGMGLNLPILSALLVQLAPTDHRAAFAAAFVVVLRAGQSLGPVLMAGAHKIGGMPATFLGGATIAALALGVVTITLSDVGEPPRGKS